jgi:hypothetical protein
MTQSAFTAQEAQSGAVPEVPVEPLLLPDDDADDALELAVLAADPLVPLEALLAVVVPVVLVVLVAPEPEPAPLELPCVLPLPLPLLLESELPPLLHAPNATVSDTTNSRRMRAPRWVGNAPTRAACTPEHAPRV